MRTRLNRLLTWLRITDVDGNLSLTHAALVFAGACIWTGKPISLTEFGTLAIALGAYQMKKVLAKPVEKEGPSVDTVTPTLNALLNRVGALEQMKTTAETIARLRGRQG